MGRIPEQDRLSVVDAHIGHWQQADIVAAGPIEIVTGYGVAQLQAQRDEYHALQETIAQVNSDAEFARAERDATWGTSVDDDNGVWFRLRQYKTMVRVRLGARHPLTRTVPNLGRVFIRDYVTIIHKFLDHWERVNAAIEPDVTLGDFPLAALVTAHDVLVAKSQAVDSLESQAAFERERREQLFGDEAQELRDPTSIISRLLLYHATIQATYPNQPIADSLPDIFPSGGPSLPTFRFNFEETSGGVDTWLENPGLAGAAKVFLKEGIFEATQPLDPASGNLISHNWDSVTIIDDLDQFDLLDASDSTIAHGVFDASLERLEDGY